MEENEAELLASMPSETATDQEMPDQTPEADMGGDE